MSSTVSGAAKHALPSYVEVINDPRKIDWRSMSLRDVQTVLSEVETRGSVYNRRHIIPVYKAAYRAGWRDIATIFLKRVERPYRAAVKKQLTVKRIMDLAAYSALYVAVVALIVQIIDGNAAHHNFFVVGGTYFVGRVLIRVIFAKFYTENDDLI